MDKNALMQELETYSLEDLELIWKTQQDDYSMEELAVIHDVLEQRRKAHAAEVRKQSYTAHCVISLLFPIAGFVLGIILLLGQQPEKKTAGKRCLIAAVISVFLWLFMLHGGFSAF